ncbi:MAG: hypothetical protein R3E45_08440 [Rhodocyclaceae bacterium]
MEVFDALSVEGSKNYSVLCYGLFSTASLQAAFEALWVVENRSKSKIHRLIFEEWPNGILLNEVEASSGEDVPSTILLALDRMFDSGPCLAAFCMYDGAFGTYDDIFSPEVADQIYAFCFAKGQQIVNLDSVFLSTREWASVIALCNKRLRGSLSKR